MVNPIVAVPSFSVTRLKMCAFYTKHLVRISRPLNITIYTLRNLSSYEEMRLIEKDHTNPTDLSPLMAKEDMVSFMENTDPHLLQTQDTMRVALAYVTRVNVAVLPHADDLSTNYSSIKLETISRCMHGTMSYNEDNKDVWSILQRALSKTLSFSSIRCHANAEDGRAAYLDLDQNYCGRNKVENILEKVEGDIATTYYSEDKVNFTFETYVAIHPIK